MESKSGQRVGGAAAASGSDHQHVVSLAGLSRESDPRDYRYPYTRLVGRQTRADAMYYRGATSAALRAHEQMGGAQTHWAFLVSVPDSQSKIDKILIFVMKAEISRMSNVVAQDLFHCFRDPVSSGTNEEGALRLLSGFPYPDQVREIRGKYNYDLDSLLHYACRNGWYDVSRKLVEQYHCDVHLRNRWSNTPLHYACQGKGNVDIVRFLVVDQHCDPACSLAGVTPLHYACNSGKLDIVRFLVEECHCDPFRSKDTGDTPLHWATLTVEDSVNVVTFLLSRIPPLKLITSLLKKYNCQHFQLLQAFKRCRTEYPLESAFKIFVLGNHAAGKSTLVKIIENEITSLFGSFAGQWRNISKDAVELLTAGIVPVSIESRRLGQIVIYDMAGQYQYYSSHAALLRNLVSSSASMFLVVVSLNQSQEDIVRQLQYWNSFIANCCTSAGKPPTVAVFSHADQVMEEKPEGKFPNAVKALTHSKASSSFSEVVTLDCRKLASAGLTRISKIVAGCCAKFRQTFQVDFAVHLLYAFISSRLAGEIVCTVSELQRFIRIY